MIFRECGEEWGHSITLLMDRTGGSFQYPKEDPSSTRCRSPINNPPARLTQKGYHFPWGMHGTTVSDGRARGTHFCHQSSIKRGKKLGREQASARGLGRGGDPRAWYVCLGGDGVQTCWSSVICKNVVLYQCHHPSDGFCQFGRYVHLVLS